MPEHNKLTGAQLHEPKGISAAAANTVLKANGAGSGTWGPITFSETPQLVATSYVTQGPTATDTPYQVTFGPAQNTIADDVMIDAAGNITFNTGGVYFARLSLNFGRLSGAGISILYAKGVLNGTQVGTTASIEMDSADVIMRTEQSQFITAPTGAVVHYEFYRDSSGTNSGELLAPTPTLSSYTQAPSALILLTNIQIT